MKLSASHHRRRGVAYNDLKMLATALALFGAMVWYDPVTVDRRRNAELKDQCKERLAQLGRALDAAIRSGGDRFPIMPIYPMKIQPSRLAFLAPDAPANLYKLLRNSVRDDEVFICPSAPDVLATWDLSYIWNEDLNGRARAGMTPAQLAATWVLTDLEAAFHAFTDEELALLQMTPDMVTAPHVRGYNVLYADGAVKWQAQPPRMRITAPPRTGAPGGTGVGGGGASGR